MKIKSPLHLSKDYPYMYARVSAKKAKLLEQQDYENMLKMQPNQIAKKLGEGEYKDEIDDLGARHEGVELVELALNRNLSNTMQHLSSISPESLERVINVYLRRYDILTLKRLLRWKQGGEKDGIEDLFVPASGYSFEDLSELAEKDIDEIIRTIEFEDSEVDYQEYLEGKEDLPEIEQALDRAYYDELQILAGKARSRPFKKFVEEELEYENIRTALRLKKYGVSQEKIEDHLTGEIKSPLVEKIAKAEDIEEAIEIINRSDRTEVSEDQIEELEHALDTQRLRRALRMLHTEPMGITSILGYIVAKIIEVRNLRMLIRAKETGIQNPETIRKNLVIA